MNRFFLTFAVVVLAGSALPRTQAADVSFDFFYNNIEGGSWVEVADYGYCWQPDVAVNSSKWRPYTDGYWVYSDAGWTWVSYEDFGWATYHYGRWVRLADRGWVWAVGRDNELEWGPAWVSWRTGGDRIGWAPLPPRGRRGYERGTIGARVDIDFDIGPSYYNFVDVRYIGEPVLRERIYEPSQNVTYIRETVNVTNITYQNNVVYNYGPDYNAVVARSSRPIPRLTLERQTNVDPAAATNSGALMKVDGQKLIVTAPPAIKPGPKAAPPVVKEKIAQAKIDNGWSGTDPKAQEELKKKIQTEDPAKVPAPSASASAAATSASPIASASEAASVSASPSASPATSVSPSASSSVSASTSPAASGSPRGKEKKGVLSPSPATSMSPAASASPAVKGNRGKLGGQAPGASASPATSLSPATSAAPAFKNAKSKVPDKIPGASASPATTPNLGKTGKDKHDATVKPTSSAFASPPSTPASGRGKSKLDSTSGTMSPPSSASPTAELPEKVKKSNKVESVPAPAVTPIQPQGHGGRKMPDTDQPPAGGGEGSHGNSSKPLEATTAPATGRGPTAAPSESKKAKPEVGAKADKKAGEPTPSPTP